MIKQISISTKLGWISAYENNGKLFKIEFKKLEKQKKSKVLINFKRKLVEFLNKKKKIKIPHLILGNKIQKKIWNELKKIQFGSTTTYGTIAKKYKLSPRYVGKICSQNKLPLVIPCHRVIKSDGTLGGFTVIGGVKLKKKILEFEKFK
tara:strand:- start:314 stop:760 length:447 start_codon:yes stop_codon:yes gene_type:complete